MRSWIMMVITAAVTATAVIPIRIAHTRKRSSMMARNHKRDFDEIPSVVSPEIRRASAFVSLERSMHSAQQPSYAKRNDHGRVGLGLDGTLQCPLKTASGFAGRLRGGIVNVLRCVHGIAGDACRIFLRFSKGSTEIWVGGSSFRHGISTEGGCFYR
jgi:hypothetical protein